MKTLLSQIKNQDELKQILEDIELTDEYDWTMQVQVSNKSKQNKPIKKNCQLCADKSCNKGCGTECKHTLNFSKFAKNMYGYIVHNTFGFITNKSLNKRVCNLVKNFDGKMFASYEHELRFKRVIKSTIRVKPTIAKKTFSALFLLTITDNLWQKAKKYANGDFVDFNNMAINSLNVDEYAILQIAKTVYYSEKLILTSESIEMSELVDPDIITDKIFKMYINGQLVKKHGIEVLTLDYLKNR